MLTFGRDKSSRKITVRPVIPKGYAKLVKVLVDKALRKGVGYPARVYVRNFGEELEHLYGELQVMVKYDLYLEVMKRYDKPMGSNIAGIDINVDRVNLVIIKQGGDIVWMHTTRFPQVIARGYPRKSAWSIVGEKIHEVLKHAYHHGASVVAVENPEIVGYLRYYWIRNGDRGLKNYNYRVSMFRNSIIERLIWKAPLYALHVVPVDPRGTTSSKEHEYIMKSHRLDGHMASAYLMALKARRTLSNLQKP